MSSPRQDRYRSRTRRRSRAAAARVRTAPVSGAAASRGTYRELPTGHWPMLSAPRELAALLAEAGGAAG